MKEKEKDLTTALKELEALKKAYSNLKKDYKALRETKATATPSKKEASAFEYVKTWITTTKKHTKGDKESISLKQVMNAINNMKTDKEKEEAMKNLEAHETIKTTWWTIERIVKKTNKKKGGSKK